MCAAGGVGACGAVFSVWGTSQIGSQASAATEKIAFLGFSHRWDSLVSGIACYSDWLCGLQNLPQNHVMQ